MLGAGGHGVSGYMLVQAKSTSLERIVPFRRQKPCDTCRQLRDTGRMKRQWTSEEMGNW